MPVWMDSAAAQAPGSQHHWLQQAFQDRHLAWEYLSNWSSRLSTDSRHVSQGVVPRSLGGSHAVQERTALTPSPCARRRLAAPARPPAAQSCHVPAPDSGRLGRGDGRRCRRPTRPGGGTRKRPPRPEPPCNRRRPEPSCAGPSDPPAMGDEDEDEGCAVELRITEGGAGAARGCGTR